MVYVAQLDGEPDVRGADDARDARWFPLSQLPPLAFDHEQIVADAVAGRSRDTSL